MSRKEDANLLDLVFDKVMLEKIKLNNLLTGELVSQARISEQGKHLVDMLDTLKLLVKIIRR